MNRLEVMQQFLQLESRDVVRKWFEKIHKREINSVRVKEINFAAKQASEYLRNSKNADFTVRPLLTYYGINLLTRALVLLLKKNGGERSLKSGHGVVTKKWSQILSSTSISESLNNIGLLEVETCNGLFSELIDVTDNRTSIHLFSSAVDWGIKYAKPKIGDKLTLNDILIRIPSLKADLNNIELKERHSHILGSLSYNNNGLKCDVYSNFGLIADVFSKMGYNVEQNDKKYVLSCSSEVFIKRPPVFYHDYLNSPFGIPQLYVVQPFDNSIYYSEIAITFLLSYYLGMLVRYFPTHWTSLVQGENGDMYWPILNRAQNYIENVYPELILELINDILEKG